MAGFVQNLIEKGKRMLPGLIPSGTMGGYGAPESREKILRDCVGMLGDLCLERESAAGVEAFFRYLVCDAGRTEPVPFNFLVISDAETDADGELAAAFRQTLRRALRRINSEYPSVCEIPEDYLLGHYPASLHLLENNKVLVIKDCPARPMTDEEQRIWMDIAAGFERSPAVVKILCGPNEALETRFRPVEHLWYRVFREHIRFREFNVQDVERQLAGRMSQAGFKGDDGFWIGMKDYLKIVYPKADLKGTAFVRDLLERSETLYYRMKKQDRVFDADCVPACNKTTLPQLPPHWEEKGFEAFGITAGEGQAAGSKEAEAAGESQGTDTAACAPEGNGAVIFIVLSTFKKAARQLAYTAKSPDGDRSYFGIQTEDAPIQYLMEEIFRSGRRLTKVLCVTSYEVTHESIAFFSGDEGGTAFSRLKDLVTDRLKFLYGEGCGCDFTAIPYDYDEETDLKCLDDEANAKRIFACIAREMSGIKAPVYLDYTSGFRDSSFLTTAILRFFEYSGHQCEKIVYSHYFRREIIDIRHIYKMFQMINGTDEFVASGRAEQLLRLFPDEEGGSGKAAALVRSMQSFSEAVSLSMIERLDEVVQDTARSLNDIASAKELSLHEEMLQHLVPTIKEKLYIDKLIANVGDTAVIDYTYLILWCADNRMLQQALTLYVEKMPVWYFREEMLSPYVSREEAAERYARNRKIYSSWQCAGFYTCLYEKINERFAGPEDSCAGGGPDAATWKEMLRKLSAMYDVEKKKISSIQLRDRFLGMAKSIFDKQYEAQYSRFKEIIEENYETDGKKKDSPTLSENIKNIYCDDNTVGELLISMKKGPLRTYILTGKTEENLTYRKCSDAIGRLLRTDEAALAVDIQRRDELVLILAYYLAVKILRNQIIHVNEAKEEDAEAEAAREYLGSIKLPAVNGTEYTICLDMTEENIRRLIHDGLQASRDWRESHA